MSQILLIRHGETDLRGTFCGHTDPPLNENGRKQLHILNDSLRSHNITDVYTSDLLRAASTAQSIAEIFEARLHTDKRLREVHFGDWEALTWTQIEEQDNAYAQRWIERYPNLGAPNGELYDGFRDRVLRAMHTIRTTPATGDVAIVTHAGVMQLILTLLGGKTPQEAYEQTRSYCSVIPFTSVYPEPHV